MSSKKTLDDLMYGLTGKSKVILVLLASGEYTFDRIRKMSVADLRKKVTFIKKQYPDLLDTMNELIHQREESDTAFQFSITRKYSINNIRDILTRAYKRCGMEYKSLEDFVNMNKK